jgi:hypothetical protein
MALSIVQGETNPIPYQLLVDSDPADLTGATVSIIITDRRGNETTSTGEVTIVDTTDGKVNFTPGSTGDFTRAKSPYSVRWKIEAPSGISYFPNSATPEYWVVSL